MLPLSDSPLGLKMSKDQEICSSIRKRLGTITWLAGPKNFSRPPPSHEQGWPELQINSIYNWLLATHPYAIRNKLLQPGFNSALLDSITSHLHSAGFPGQFASGGIYHPRGRRSHGFLRI